MANRWGISPEERKKTNREDLLIFFSALLQNDLTEKDMFLYQSNKRQPQKYPGKKWV